MTKIAVTSEGPVTEYTADGFSRHLQKAWAAIQNYLNRNTGKE